MSQLFTESQNRIQSMALIHERLYKAEDLARIDIAEYIKNLTDQLLRSYRGIGESSVELQMDIDPVFLNIDKAVPCGLIINELVSNALKHAFPASNPTGSICIEARTDGKHQLTLVVRDDGVGMPSELDIYQTQSLGLTLVTTLTKQIRGNIELYRDKGTEFRITFAA